MAREHAIIKRVKGSGKSGLRLSHLFGQDRNPDSEQDDGPELCYTNGQTITIDRLDLQQPASPLPSL